MNRRPGTAGPEVLVLGGGIVGLACARELALEGFTVEVVERLPAGSEASLAAAGMLAPLGETGPAGGPLFVACRASRDLWRDFLPALESASGLGIDHDQTGTLLLALDDEGEARLEATERAAAALGEPAERCALEAVPRWVPGVAPDLRGALLLHGEHRVDNVAACAALGVAAERLGVALSYGLAVERVERAGEGVRVSGAGWTREARLLVLAAGAWSGTLPGLPALPVRPVRGQMLRLDEVDWPWRGAVREGRLYAVRRGARGAPRRRHGRGGGVRGAADGRGRRGAPRLDAAGAPRARRGRARRGLGRPPPRDAGRPAARRAAPRLAGPRRHRPLPQRHPARPVDGARRGGDGARRRAAGAGLPARALHRGIGIIPRRGCGSAQNLKGGAC